MIYIDENIPLLAETLAPYCDVRLFHHSEISNRLLAENNCTALFVRSTLRVDEELLRDTPVRFVGTATSGIDHIDAGYLQEHGISLADARGSNANSVAEYVLFGIAEWALQTQSDITEQSIGIIGYGQVGSLVAYYAKQMGMSVIVNDPPLRETRFSFPPDVVDEYCKLEALLTNADIVTNHVPLTAQGDYPTQHLLGIDELELLQEDSLFIHSSRGGVVDEQVLLHDAQAKNITTIIDVWQGEPCFNTVLAERAYIATPHIAGHSFDGKLQGSLMMAEAYALHAGINIDTTLINEALAHPRKRIGQFTSLKELHQCLSTARDIREDSSRFKALTPLSEEQRSKAFGYLRQHYPQRRETMMR